MSRIQKLQNLVDLTYIVNPIDIYYLTGEKISAGKLIVCKDCASLFVDGRYIEKCKDNKEVIVNLDEYGALNSFLSCISFSNVTLDPDNLSHSQFLEIEKLFCDKKVILGYPVRQMRMIKDKYELEKMQKSADLNFEGYLFIRDFIKEGMSENNVAWELEKFFREHGAQRLAFDSIISFGSNTSFPHHRPSSRRLKNGDPVLIDIGIVVDEYTSDLTRTFVFGDELPEYSKLEHLVKDAHDVALQLCKPGVKICDIDGAARSFFKKVGMENEFKHSLGHSLGLEVHEYPSVSTKAKDEYLYDGMVITIEPGLYIEGLFGCRYEDTIQITENGYKNFY